MREHLAEQLRPLPRAANELALVPAALELPNSATGKRVGIIRKHRFLIAGLGFAVTAQMMVHLIFAAIPVVASEIAARRNLDVQFIALYYPLTYTVAFFSNFAVPQLLARLGSAGLSLICIGAAAAGSLSVLPTASLLIVAAPLVLGFAIGGATPATSQVVAPHASPRTAGLVMSIRQSAISAGAMLAGVIVPVMVIYWDQRALLVLGLAGAGFAIILLPTLRWLNDRGPSPDAAWRPFDPVKRLLAMSGMRQILCAVLTYLMMVACLRSFLTVYLVRDLGFELATAGLIFGGAQLAGIAGQICCAVVSDRWLSARTVLALNGGLMTAAALLAANFTRHWPIAGIVSVTVLLGFFSVGAVSVVLGEITRRSPPGQVGALVSGGNLFVVAGCALGPLVFGAVGSLFGYSGGLVAVAVCTLVGAMLSVPLPHQRTRTCVETPETPSNPRIGTTEAVISPLRGS